MNKTFAAPGARVLVVDDNKINLKVTEGVLKSFQIKPDLVSSGAEAIEKVREKQYDMILMDHLMPEMDGVEATRRIRELETGYTQNVPIIALTANKDEGIREYLLGQNINDFLTKPIDLQEICDIMRKWLPDSLLPEEERTQENDKSRDDIPSIEGLDVEQGIELSGGLDLYLEILGDFYIMIPEKARKIEKCLADHMLHDYTIEVHALKSTARLIGAIELSERCYHLEQLGKVEEEEQLIEDTPEMLALYRSYINILRPYGEKNNGEKQQVPTEELISLLQQLYNGIDRFDLDEVDKTMQRLEECQIPKSCQDYMEMLRVYIADVAMEDIMNTAKQMIVMLKQI